MNNIPLAAISLGEHELTRFFVAVVALMAGAHIVGSLFARLKMPRVIGEIAGGLLLGPTVLGALAPTPSAGSSTPSPRRANSWP